MVFQEQWRFKQIFGGDEEISKWSRKLPGTWRRKKNLWSVQARFDELFDKAVVPLCFVDKDKGMIKFNTQFEKTFGYKKDEIPTLDEWWQLAYPEPQYRKWVINKCEEILQRAIKINADIEPIEYCVTCRNGDIRAWKALLGLNFEIAFIKPAVSCFKKPHQQNKCSGRKLEPY